MKFELELIEFSSLVVSFLDLATFNLLTRFFSSFTSESFSLISSWCALARSSISTNNFSWSSNVNRFAFFRMVSVIRPELLSLKDQSIFPKFRIAGYVIQNKDATRRGSQKPSCQPVMSFLIIDIFSEGAPSALIKKYNTSQLNSSHEAKKALPIGVTNLSFTGDSTASKKSEIDLGKSTASFLRAK